MMNKIYRYVFFYVSFIIVTSLLLMCLMWSVYLIPIERIRPNAKVSADIIEITPERPRFYNKIPGFFLDTWTDSRILNIASFKGNKNPFVDSLINYRVHYLDPPYVSLSVAVKSGIVEGAELRDYARYWHGYLLFVKPLLVLFDLGKIRYVNLLFQLGILLYILYLMYKKLGLKYCVAFGTTICFFNPITSYICLQYATVYNIMLLAVLWILCNKDLENRYIFFVVGATTSIFDFLTYPLVTLGIPLIVYISLYERSFKDNIRCVVKNSFLWAFSYIGMWFAKWGLATFVTGQNIIKDGLKSVSHRMWGLWQNDPFVWADINYLNAVTKNLKEIFNIGGLVYIGCFCLIISFYYYRKTLKFFLNYKAIILLGIGLMPFVWYGVVMQHSIQHPWMTYKILAITIYALLTSVVCCMKPKAT